LLEESSRGNRDALHEVVGNRPLFRLDGSAPLNFCQFLLALGCSRLPRSLGIQREDELEAVYDGTMLRLIEMPPEASTNSGRARRHDARAILSAVVEKVRRRLASCPTADPIQEETIAAQELQGAVVRHYVYVCLDVRRTRLLGRSLYVWRVGKGWFRLWMPRWLAGPRRRAWLDAAISGADPARPGEQDRIQRIVDQRLGWGYQVDLSEVDRQGGKLGQDSPLESLIQKELRQQGLGELIAQEKADNIEQQRPAIRALGKDLLRDLVLGIYADVNDGRYNQAATAAAFSLSTPTLTRFAGARSKLADLWVNTSRVLASHPVFVEIVRDMRLWDKVQTLLQRGQRQSRKR